MDEWKSALVACQKDINAVIPLIESKKYERAKPVLEDWHETLFEAFFEIPESSTRAYLFIQEIIDDLLEICYYEPFQSSEEILGRLKAIKEKSDRRFTYYLATEREAFKKYDSGKKKAGSIEFIV